MIQTAPKHIMRLLAIILSFSLTVSLGSPVFATDTVDSLEQSTSDLKNEVSDLENELENLGNEISSISQQINTISEEIKQTKSELAIAKGNEEAQYTSMKTRIKYMYENGNNSLMEMLFSASSIADFLKKADLFSAISEYDRESLKQLVDTQQTIALKEEKLSQEQANLLFLQEELNKKEDLLKDKLSDASADLAALNAKLAKAREDAQKAQEELEQKVEPVIPQKPERPPVPDHSDSGNTSDSNTDSDKNTDISTSASDIELFAALIECEAGSTNYEGMLAVASVVVNRMKHSSYPDTLRGVIYQAGQFTPAHNGKLDRVLNRGVKSSCVAAANDALAGKNNVGNCLSFRSAGSGHTGTIIGGNVFF